MRPFSVAVLVLVALGASGCGSQPESSEPEAKAPDLVRTEGKVGRLPEEPFVVGEGDRRIVLAPSRGRDGELCLKATASDGEGPSRRCLGPGSPDPVVAFVGLGGPSKKRVDWTSLIGLARGDVERVTLQLQSGPPRTLDLRSWPGFGWSGFLLEPGASGTMTVDMLGRKEVNRPNHLQAFDARGRKLDGPRPQLGLRAMRGQYALWGLRPIEAVAGCPGPLRRRVGGGFASDSPR